MPAPVLLVELNEVNFAYVREYAARGHLPVLQALISRHGLAETTSEEVHEHLEPWIQWVTAHTGRTFAQHGIFRLGDIVNADIPQIWEQLEAEGLRVGAVSPMNAKNRLKSSAFFVPDPWTSTRVDAPRVLERLYRGVAEAVNENARGRISPKSAFGLLGGLLAYASPSRYADYLRMTFGSLGRPWRRAMFLDLLLSDVFERETRRTRPDFASLFLNAAAHIQHHYLFCAQPYSGPHRNPDWYVAPGQDPVLEVYRLYDGIVGRLQRNFPHARIMLATGLHQVAHEHLTFYWRLSRHAEFLQGLGAPFQEVFPRMSRDFLVTCATEEDARTTGALLKSAVANDGVPLFEVDNRGRDLFVMLTYPGDIGQSFEFTVGNRKITGLRDAVSFVALKNGEHHGTGYFLDTGAIPTASPARFPLADVPARIREALGIGPHRKVLAA
jgi:hypothetical protein